MNIMDQLSLSKRLKLITFMMGIIGFVICAYVIPVIGGRMVAENGQKAGYYWPWLLFIWLLAIPFYLVLIKFWRICVNIGSDKSFTEENAGYLSVISKLAFVDTALCFVGNIAFLMLGMSSANILIIFLILVFIGIAISIASAALAHLVLKASNIQKENQLTI
jgi:MFS family permease